MVTTFVASSNLQEFRKSGICAVRLEGEDVEVLLV